MQAFIVLCDAAQIDRSTGKVNILGGDWALTSPDLISMTLVVFVRANWEEATTPKPFTLRLLADDGKAIEALQNGELKPVQFKGTLALNMKAVEADDAARLVDIHTSFTVDVPSIGQVLTAGTTYTWSLDIDGTERSCVRFAVRQPAETDEPD